MIPCFFKSYSKMKSSCRFLFFSVCFSLFKIRDAFSL